MQIKKWQLEPDMEQQTGSRYVKTVYCHPAYLTYMQSQSVSTVAQSCPTLCDPMNCSTPGLPVHHQLPEFTQTHVHRVSDAIQPSHPLLSPSPAPNPSQHQSLFQWVTLRMRSPKVHHVKCQAGWSTAGIKISGRNISNLRYADDNTLMAESEEEKASWWKWKRRVKKLA